MTGGIDAETQLNALVARYTPDIALRGRAILDALQARLPNAMRLVYDTYNALAVGFGPDDRASHAILSVALYPKWVSLFFLQGASLPDPQGILKGSGNVARHVVLGGASDLDRAEVSALIDQALERAKVKLPADGVGRLVIKSIATKQRPRRPD